MQGADTWQGQGIISPTDSSPGQAGFSAAETPVLQWIDGQEAQGLDSEADASEAGRCSQEPLAFLPLLPEGHAQAAVMSTSQVLTLAVASFALIVSFASYRQSVRGFRRSLALGRPYLPHPDHYDELGDGDPVFEITAINDGPKENRILAYGILYADGRHHAYAGNESEVADVLLAPGERTAIPISKHGWEARLRFARAWNTAPIGVFALDLDSRMYFSLIKMNRFETPTLHSRWQAIDLRITRVAYFYQSSFRKQAREYSYLRRIDQRRRKPIRVPDRDDATRTEPTRSES